MAFDLANPLGVASSSGGAEPTRTDIEPYLGTNWERASPEQIKEAYEQAKAHLASKHKNMWEYISPRKVWADALEGAVGAGMHNRAFSAERSKGLDRAEVPLNASRQLSSWPPVTSNSSPPVANPITPNATVGDAADQTQSSPPGSEFADRFDKFRQLAATPPYGLDIKVNEAKRSPETQQKYYNQGRSTPGQIVTNARPGMSYHQYDAAKDVSPTNMSQADYERTMQRMFAENPAMGVEWGGNWRNFKDTPHVQLAGTNIPSLRRGDAPRGPTVMGLTTNPYSNPQLNNTPDIGMTNNDYTPSTNANFGMSNAPTSVGPMSVNDPYSQDSIVAALMNQPNIYGMV